MLQRAASNAYSWWWASHIRTTQSKWLDANLQDMENRVKVMLKLLGEEADSFGKRAEMYYRTRPEVISHVEQLYRAYRALVERYDHISKELHKANHTIAAACPEQVAEYAMLQDEDDDFPRAITPIDSRKIDRSTVEEILKRRGQPPGPRLKNRARSAPPPHTSKEEADQLISRLQKAILVLQTEKEFVKSSYEAGIARYWEIEKQIADTQEEICQIQDEFDAHAAIRDDEARALMTIAALRSCQGTVSNLVHDFEELIRIAAVELEKTKSLRAQLHAINGNPDIQAASTDTSVNTRVIQELLELRPAYEKIESFFANSSESSVHKVAEDVDQLVDKITNLELKFPKQSAQIKRLNQENESIKNKLDELQDEMALRDDPSDLSEQLKLLDDELSIVRALESSIVEEEVSVSTAFYEVFSCINNISKALESIGPQDPYALSTAVGDGATVPTDVDLKYLTGENTLMVDGGLRDINPQNITDTLGQDSEDASEVVNDNVTNRIHGSENGSEEEVPLEDCAMQQVRHEEATNSDSNINPFTTSGNGAAADHSDSPSEEVFHSSSGCTNKTWDMGNDGSESFVQGKKLEGEYPMGSETHLLHLGSIDTLGKEYISNEERSPIEASELLVEEVAEGSLAGRNKMQVLKNIGDVYSFTENSLIKEGRLGDGKSQNICGHIDLVASSNNSFKEKDPLEESQLPEATRFSGEGKRLELWHTNEAESAEEFPKQGSQLDDPQNIESLNICGQIESPEEDGCLLLDHVDNIQDIRNTVSVDECHPEARDKISPFVRAGDSEETKGLHQQAIEVPKDVLQNFNSITEEGVSSWQEFLLDGLEGREAILLADYTSILQNYKETKRRLAELEKKNQEHLEETKVVIRELRNSNSMKYVEIQSLRNLVNSEMPPSKAGSKTASFSNVRSFREIDRSHGTLDRDISIVDETNFSNIEVMKNMSPFEAKFRSEIDALMEENLQFLVRYSMTFHHMQEFDRRDQEVRNEMEDVEDKKIGETEPAEKKLRELRTELDVWFEQNALLGEEVQLKSTSLCKLQEEIVEALRGSSEMDGARFTPYEAAKFQGEVLNMQQSNSKIESELQAASEHMRGIQDKVNNALQELRESFELSSRRLSRARIESGYEKQFKHFPSRTRVPLRNFLFGAKRKKKSIFACMNPTLQKQFSDL